MRLLDFPELRQAYEYDCGAKVLQAVLTYYGIEIREELLIKYAKTNSKEGTSRQGIINTLKKFHLKYDSKNMTITELRDYIDKKIPVIILLQAWNGKNVDYTESYSDGHWVIAVGYNRDKIFFEDPYSFKRTFLKNKELETRWHAQEEEEKILNYGIAVFGKKKTYNSKKIVHMD